MLYLLIKAGLSGIIIAVVSEISKRYPGFGGLIASLPLVSVIGMIWLWRDTGDVQRLADHGQATFWFVLPSPPLFRLMPALLYAGICFYPALAGGSILTVSLYGLMIWAAPRFGLKL